MPLYYLDCRQKVAVARNQHGTIDLSRGRQFDHIHAEEDIHPLLSEYGGAVLSLSAVLQLSQSNLEARQPTKRSYEFLGAREALPLFRSWRAALVWKTVVVISAQNIATGAEMLSKLP